MGRDIAQGATDVSTVIRIVDSTAFTPEEGVVAATGGLALWYRRDGGLEVALTGASDLSALDDAHADGGMLHMNEGYYRIDVQDAAFAAGSSEVVIGGTVTGMIVIAARHDLVGHNPQTGLTGLAGAIGAWTGSGVNTILGAFKALMRRDVSLPTDIGGTNLPISDSTEALRIRADEIAGQGFSTTSHSLKKQAETTNTGSAATSSSSSTTGDLGVLRSGGYIDRFISMVRKETDEPETNAKYSDSALLLLWRQAWGQVWSDLSRNADSAPIVRYDLSITAATQDFWLPPNIGQILRIYKVVTESGLVEFELTPRSHYNPFGPGFTIEGNVLRTTPEWDEAHTMRIEYIPNGDVSIHEGTGAYKLISGTSPNQFTFDIDAGTLPYSTLRGSIDRRPNAYGGYMLRVFGAIGVQEETLISGSSNVTLSLSPPTRRLQVSTPAPYEVVPMMMHTLESVVSLNVARRIHANEGNTKAHQLLTQQYREDLRAVRLAMANSNVVRSDRLEGDNSRNPRYGNRGGNLLSLRTGS